MGFTTILTRVKQGGVFRLVSKQTNNGVNKMHELELNMYEEIFLFTTNPITDYLILFVVGVIIIWWIKK